MNSSTNFLNSRGCLVATIMISIVGIEVFIVQPGFVQGLVEYRQLSETEAGFVASVEMWGIAAATLLFSMFSRFLNWRYCIVVASLVMALANYLCSLELPAAHFLFLRFSAGFGSGVLIALGFVIMGMTAKPDRNFALMILWILVYAAVLFYLMPLAYQHIGFSGLMVFFATFSLLAVFCSPYVPANGGVQPVPLVWSAIKVLGVSCLFVYFLAQGVVWAYLFLMGVSAGVAEQWVADGLSLAQFSGIAGAMLAAFFADRFGRLRPLLIGLLFSVLALCMIISERYEVWVYIASVSLFNFAWNMTHPYLLAVLADLDDSGQLVAVGVAAQMVALAIGPAIAAVVWLPDSYRWVIALGIGLFIATALLVITTSRQGRLGGQGL